MANYKEATITAGAKWQRAWQVVIENKYGKIPSCIFYEETIVDTGEGTVVSTPIPGQLTELMGDSTKTFNVVNPITGEVVSPATYQDVYVLLSSLYLSLATARDAPPPEEPVVPPPEEPIV